MKDTERSERSYKVIFSQFNFNCNTKVPNVSAQARLKLNLGLSLAYYTSVSVTGSLEAGMDR